ncbi:FGGY-family carbohydrate kinase [Paenibacillus sp. y28]|uniref:FGGY-family carbohydrate kinase n=1 Tax=Paenibacillus sp. y28 TaxID=3129110 RepID=UPI0030198F91
MYILGIDIGTTNSKAGLFKQDGTMVAIASRPTQTYYLENGVAYYDPEQMWQSMASCIQEVTEKAGKPQIASIGIASMAESGLLIDRASGKPRSMFMPWFDQCSKPQSDFIMSQSDAFENFRRSGLHGSFKLGLAKLLWLREQQPEAFGGSVWLSASGYIAYRLTGQMAFDYSLAARTYAFSMERKAWDEAWLKQFGFDASIMPQVLPSGTVLGGVLPEVSEALGLTTATKVAIAGHDHVAAALAVGSITPGVVYDSMGTAETLVGTLEEKELGRQEFEAGLSFGCHIAKDRYFWMGGNSASGGSVEWLRGLLADEQMSYETLLGLLEQVKPGPTGILYYPYLTGSGAPAPDSKAKAAWIGLTKEHGKADMIKALLEGTAYQLEAIRRVAEGISGRSIERLLVVGGGTRNPQWLQVKANITRCVLDIPPISEATLLGAALAAGIGSGVYGSAEEASQAVAGQESRMVEPQPELIGPYRKLYDEGYMALQQSLRAFYRTL